MSAVFVLLILPSFAVLFVLVASGAFWIGVGFFITYLLIIGVFSSAADSVLVSALYLIATGGRTQDFAAYSELKTALAGVDSREHGENALEKGERDYSLLMYTRR
jgi:hypothetical protein